MDLAFLVVIALATTMAVPVVGSLLIFSILIGPPAAARWFTTKPLTALWLSVAFAVGTVWASIALSFISNLPIGFFVGSMTACAYAAGRGWTAWCRTRPITAPGSLVADTASG